MKKKKNITSIGNIVVFPGTVEQLIEQAQTHMLNEQYDLANDCFEEALQYSDGDEMTLSAYAYSLYEVKSFDKAKEVCEELLKIGPSMYLEIMELYLTICMQLKQYKQVARIIDSLIEEDAIPNEQMERFLRLKELNGTIAENIEYKEETQQLQERMDLNRFKLDSFLSITPKEQVALIHSLSMVNIRPLISSLKEIVECELTHPFIKSLVLILFVEQQVDEQVTVSKFDQTTVVTPTTLKLPTEMEQFNEVSTMVSTSLEQEPSTLEMVNYLIAKHVIVTYPFEWFDFDVAHVAQAYIDFVRMMFGSIEETDSKLMEFLKKLEELTDLQEV